MRAGRFHGTSTNVTSRLRRTAGSSQHEATSSVGIGWVVAGRRRAGVPERIKGRTQRIAGGRRHRQGARSTGWETGKGAVAVRTTIASTDSPTDRAASMTADSSRRSLAFHAGASTTNTSVLPDRFASRACAATEGGRQGRNRRSSASSHKARRRGSPAASAISASSALRGSGGTDREPDIAYDLQDDPD